MKFSLHLAKLFSCFCLIDNKILKLIYPIELI